jgi:hypothetical protein
MMVKKIKLIKTRNYLLKDYEIIKFICQPLSLKKVKIILRGGFLARPRAGG